jgi:hypothetical protein
VVLGAIFGHFLVRRAPQKLPQKSPFLKKEGVIPEL